MFGKLNSFKWRNGDLFQCGNFEVVLAYKTTFAIGQSFRKKEIFRNFTIASTARSSKKPNSLKLGL